VRNWHSSGRISVYPTRMGPRFSKRRVSYTRVQVAHC
jgi:hypothetical protein